MKSAFQELPENTFSLTSQEVPAFVREVGQRFELSDRAELVCVDGLTELFQSHGGFSEQPHNSQANWAPYHNGSHAGFVMGVGVFLAHEAGETTETKDGVAIGGVYHDWYKEFSEPEKDERQSALKASEVLQANDLPHLIEPVVNCILGTIVDQNGADIIQRARSSKEEIAKYLADADLSSLIAPNAVEWALRLQIENRIKASMKSIRYEEMGRFLEETKDNLLSFIEATLNLERTHKFLSKIGRTALQPLMSERAEELQKLSKVKKPSDFLVAATGIEPVTSGL